MQIKEYQIRQNEFKRPVIITKNVHNIQKVHDIGDRFKNSEILVDQLNEIFDISHLAEEYVWMLCLTSDNKVNGVFEISHGSVNGSYFCTREIIQKALLAGAVYIAVAHCHPSGNPEPSDLDMCVTKKLYEACKLIGIPLLDHVIIGCESGTPYYSFAEKKVMENW